MTAKDAGNGRSKGGAPEGNKYAMRHGLYSARPVELSRYGRRRINQYRCALERAVLDAHGEINVRSAGYVHTATEAQRVAIGNRERHAEHQAKMTIDQQLASDREYVRLLETRDRAVAKLGLPTNADDWVARLYDATTPEADGDEPEPLEPEKEPPARSGRVSGRSRAERRQEDEPDD